MKNTKNTKSCLNRLVLAVLIAAMVLCFASCGHNDDQTVPNGEGTKSFTFEVVDIDGNVTSFDIESNAATVGDALLAEGLIEGSEGDYGLYVTVVNGITADYNVDGHYWAFYVNGEYASTGVDATEIEDGAVYSFKVE